MARIRTIKPQFWKHEDLSKLPEATHMLAAALLNYADDEGYFNANPGLVRSECSPLREPSVSIQDSLISLLRIGFIELFPGTDGKRYGRIVTFDDHQRVNRPTPSKIKYLRAEDDSSLIAHQQFSESSSPEKEKEKEKEGKGIELSNDNSCQTAAAVRPPKSDPIPYQAIVDAYNGTMTDLPKVRDLTTKRRAKIRSVWTGRRKSAEFWREYFAECQDDDFFNGTGPYRNGHENWRPNFDYLIREDVVARVFERAIDRIERIEREQGHA